MAFEVKVRECVAEDAGVLALIGAATLLEAYAGFLPGSALKAHCARYHQAEVYGRLLREAGVRAWLAEAEPDAAPVGYAMLTQPEFPAEIVQTDDAELRRIYLFSRFHGQGLAQCMWARAVEAANQMGARRLLIGLHAENHRAMAFYRKQGCVQVGERRFRLGEVEFKDPVMALKL